MEEHANLNWTLTDIYMWKMKQVENRASWLCFMNFAKLTKPYCKHLNSWFTHMTQKLHFIRLLQRIAKIDRLNILKYSFFVWTFSSLTNKQKLILFEWNSRESTENWRFHSFQCKKHNSDAATKNESKQFSYLFSVNSLPSSYWKIRSHSFMIQQHLVTTIFVVIFT